ncbi:MAG: cobyric acid synthase [Spirochaetales bacterium]|nr:cobyric acid synthase [Spirochaetales bacterium]
MIQGTSSNVGKSLLTAALCRIYADRGFKVFPFKSQNMALNSFVTPEGLEIGRAQALQAYAARRLPEINMNPVLLKPETDSSCQVVLMGEPLTRLSGSSYFSQKNQLWGKVCEVLETVQKENDLIIIEGAGSPAEINLKANDIVNMRVARHLSAPVLLTADIDRGGVFAFLYGTLELLEVEERDLIKGFIINKFRGDISLLEPGLRMLEDLTDGRPTLGVIPYIKDLLLAQEDSVFLDERREFGTTGIDIAVIHFPHISNYDDFDALLIEKGLKLRFISRVEELGEPDWIILPGTKTTIGDLLWLKQTGLSEMITKLAEGGTPVTGICGGYQMLGRSINDDDGAEGYTGSFRGLALLPVKTDFTRKKKTIQSSAKCISSSGFLAGLRGVKISGYEIHMGETKLDNQSLAIFKTESGGFDGAASASGKIWGTYFHGAFDEAEFRRGWLKTLRWTPEGRAVSLETKRDEELDILAQTVRDNIDMNLLDRIIGL